MFQDIDGEDKEVGAEGIERVNKEFFCLEVGSHRRKQRRYPSPLVLI